MINPEDLQNRLMDQQDREIDAVEKLEESLLPCVHCAAADEELGFSYTETQCYVFCCSCKARGPLCDNEKSAALNWNTRQ